MKRILEILVATSVVAALTVPALASPHARTAQFIVLDAPGAGTTALRGTYAYAVNSSSVVTGFFTDTLNDSHGFTWADGTFTTFDIDRAQSETAAYWLNGKGTSVGVYVDSNTGVQEGFLRTAAGAISTFDGAGGGSRRTITNAINNKSVAVGDYFDNSRALHAFLRAKDGTLTQFDAPDAGKGANQGTTALDINSKGAVTGSYMDASDRAHGYVRGEEGSITKFDAPSANATFPNCINTKGWITGGFGDPGGVNHGFVRKANGKFIVFDAPHAAQTSQKGTYGSCINDRGEVTGYYTDISGVFHGFLRSKNGAIEEFDAPNSGTTVGLGTFPAGINADGVIVGYYRDSNRGTHGFLRIP